jgi:hypothetical protein
MENDLIYNRMSAKELKTIIQGLKISQRELGRWLDKDERTARRYVLGESKVSPELAILVHLLHDRPELINYVREKLLQGDEK